jgi:hypothetical protein
MLVYFMALWSILGMAVWSILKPFGCLLNGHLVYFTAIWYYMYFTNIWYIFSPFLYVVPRKIWQPWNTRGHFERFSAISHDLLVKASSKRRSVMKQGDQITKILSNYYSFYFFGKSSIYIISPNLGAFLHEKSVFFPFGKKRFGLHFWLFFSQKHPVILAESQFSWSKAISVVAM